MVFINIDLVAIYGADTVSMLPQSAPLNGHQPALGNATGSGLKVYRGIVPGRQVSAICWISYSTPLTPALFTGFVRASARFQAAFDASVNGQNTVFAGGLQKGQTTSRELSERLC